MEAALPGYVTKFAPILDKLEDAMEAVPLGQKARTKGYSPSGSLSSCASSCFFAVLCADFHQPLGSMSNVQATCRVEA